MGAVVTAVGLTAIVVDGAIWVGGAALAVGCWLALDSIYESRHCDPTAAETEEDITEAEMYTLLGHCRWVLEELREADLPLTADQLRSRTGLTDDELADALEITLGNGTVEEVGTGYAVDEGALGGVTFVRGLLFDVGRRLLRPLRLLRPSR